MAFAVALCILGLVGDEGRMQQVEDFLEESDLLAELISQQINGRWDEPTQFKNWTVNDVLVHLHYWNKMADLSLLDPTAFDAEVSKTMQSVLSEGFRPIENAAISERGEDLLQIWHDHCKDMAMRWRTVEPKKRLPWAGPSMSARSSITARQMETWAHGHEVFDLLGVDRKESERIKNIVVLGVNTFEYSFQIRGKTIPDQMPALRLKSPSGDLWTYGNEKAGSIEGSALSFAQAVTQTRNYKDTDMIVDGALAIEWMENAQCFAGAPNPVPQTGSRGKTKN